MGYSCTKNAEETLNYIMNMYRFKEKENVFEYNNDTYFYEIDKTKQGFITGNILKIITNTDTYVNAGRFLINEDGTIHQFEPFSKEYIDNFNKLLKNLKKNGKSLEEYRITNNLKTQALDLIERMKKYGVSQDYFNEILLSIPQDTREPEKFDLYGFTIDDVFEELERINQEELPDDQIEISNEDAIEILKQVRSYLKSDIPNADKFLEINKEIWYCWENDGYKNAFRR